MGTSRGAEFEVPADRFDGSGLVGMSRRGVVGSGPGQGHSVPLGGGRGMSTIGWTGVGWLGRAIETGSRRGQVPSVVAKARERMVVAGHGEVAQVHSGNDRGTSVSKRDRRALSDGRKLRRGCGGLRLLGGRDCLGNRSSRDGRRGILIISIRGGDGDGRAGLDSVCFGAGRRQVDCGSSRNGGGRDRKSGDSGGLECQDVSRVRTVVVNPARARVARADVRLGRRHSGWGGAHRIRAAGEGDGDLQGDCRGAAVAGLGLSEVSRSAKGSGPTS